MQEQQLRKNAIERYLLGESPISIYTDLQRSKEWFFKWLKRYQTGYPLWYKDKSRAPKRQQKQVAEDEKQRIISTRRRLESQRFAQIGASAIKWELNKTGDIFPSDSTINRVLKREGLIKKNSLCSQRYRVPVFYRSNRYQQYSPGRSCRPQIHKRRRQILFVQCNRLIQPPNLH